MDSVGGYVAYYFTLVDGSTLRDQIFPVSQHEEMRPYIGKAVCLLALLTAV